MTFETWLSEAYPHLAGPETAEGARIRAVANAAWNDAVQITVTRAALRVNAALTEVRNSHPDDPGRVPAAQWLGRVLVAISEMS